MLVCFSVLKYKRCQCSVPCFIDQVQYGRSHQWPDSIREQDFYFNDLPTYPRPRPRDDYDPSRRHKRDVDVPPVGSEVSVKVTRLPAYSDVILHVRVLTKYYVGPPSNKVEFRTLEGCKHCCRKEYRETWIIWSDHSQLFHFKKKTETNLSPFSSWSPSSV